MESNRLKRLEGQFQKDLAEIFREMAQNQFRGVLLSATRVAITTDVGLARCYVSVFPVKDKEAVITWLNESEAVIKNTLVQKLKGALRKMPELRFFLDDSIEQEESINKILNEGGESPIK